MAELGRTFECQNAVQTVRATRDQIAKVGMLPQFYNQLDFDKALSDLQNIDVAKTLEMVGFAVNAKNRPELLSRLSIDLEAAMGALDRFNEVVLAVVNGAIKRMDTELTSVTGSGNANIGQMYKDMIEALESIRSDVKKLAGGA